MPFNWYINWVFLKLRSTHQWGLADLWLGFCEFPLRFIKRWKHILSHAHESFKIEYSHVISIPGGFLMYCKSSPTPPFKTWSLSSLPPLNTGRTLWLASNEQSEAKGPCMTSGARLGKEMGLHPRSLGHTPGAAWRNLVLLKLPLHRPNRKTA